jgi:hypothetical protein
LTLEQFAYLKPLRASALSELVKCHWRETLLSLDLVTDTSNAAADTGSAAHAAVFAWHNGRGLTDAINVMRSRLGEFPLADLVDAERFFRDYAADPRNQNVDVVLSEAYGDVEISPSSIDPTGKPIRISGHPDQVRRENGGLYLYDLKTGNRLDGWEMIHEHSLQFAAYCLISSKLLGQRVNPGSVIRVRGYRARDRKKDDPAPPGVFWPMPWDVEDVDLLLDSVRDAVARVRRGELYPSPGSQCRYCPAGGLQECLPALKRYLAS